MTLDPATSRTDGVTPLVYVGFTGAGWYTNGAGDLGGIYGPAEAALDPDNPRVWLQGGVNPGTDGEFALIAAAYRPAVTRLLVARMDGGAGAIEIHPTGVIDAFSNPATDILLDGLFYDL